MDIKKAFIRNKLCDVVGVDEYYRRKSFNDQDIMNTTVIEYNDTLYPTVEGGLIHNKTVDNITHPVAIITDAAYKFVGNSSQFPEYSSDKKVDFTNVKTNKELMEKQKKLMEDESILMNSSSSNCFKPVIREDDSPALKLLKEAFEKKNVDLEAYKHRFASNCEFSNTIRLLQKSDKHTISVSKMQLIAKRFDLKLTLKVEDANAGVPNPIGEELEVEL